MHENYSIIEIAANKEATEPRVPLS